MGHLPLNVTCTVEQKQRSAMSARHGMRAQSHRDETANQYGASYFTRNHRFLHITLGSESQTCNLGPHDKHYESLKNRVSVPLRCYFCSAIYSFTLHLQLSTLTKTGIFLLSPDILFFVSQQGSYCYFGFFRHKINHQQQEQLVSYLASTLTVSSRHF